MDTASSSGKDEAYGTGTAAAMNVGIFFSQQTPSEHVVKDESESLLSTRKLVDNLQEDDRLRFFDVPPTIQWIASNNSKRVALQFSDQFLSYSFSISKMIEADSDVKTFILADTSYRSCCVDEVSAAHASCDAIVHYGEACLSAPTQNIPIRYVLGSLPVDTAQLLTSLEDILTDEDKANRLLVLADSPYSHAIKNIQSELQQKQWFHGVFAATTIDPSTDISAGFNEAEGSEVFSLGRHVPSSIDDDCGIYILFIGLSSSPLLPLWLMSHPRSNSIFHYDPTSKLMSRQISHSWRQLRKRLFLVEQLKDANTVGLVVGSVGVRGHSDAVQRMRELCKAAGKKIYVISVGKVNVPKLSNFADIDVFVLLSCPFGILLDSSDFFRPVLSFFEAEVALNPQKEWNADGGWTADFRRFLEEPIGVEQEGADMSLVTGKMRGLGRATEEKLKEGEAQVALYTAGDYFKERSWRGLDDGIRLDESTSLEEGRAGIAVGYGGEPGKL